MLNESEKLKPNQRTDIVERLQRFLVDYNYTQAGVAREIGVSSTTISEVLRLRYTGGAMDRHLIRVHNWMELTARRNAIVRSREFVETLVANEILQVARITAETCQMGLVFGPARIGKTFTLKAIEGDQVFGDPVVVTVTEATVRPFALCRAVCERFDVSGDGTFDRVFRRLCNRLTGTKRMLIFDEADLASYPALEMIRQLHDETGCPILFAGKPAVYEHLGLRHLGDFSEKLDQMAGRIVIKRDLTERTRGTNGEPLYSRKDIQNLVRKSGLTIRLSSDAERWLQSRASTLGMGGIGKAMILLYLAFKLAYSTGATSITDSHLEDAETLTLGNEDASRLSEVVAEAKGMKRVV